MPQVSRIKLNKKTEEKLTGYLTLILAKINNNLDMNLFLTSLLTPTEKLMLAKRVAMVILLKENMSDTQIAMALHVTRVTVSRMRYFLESRGKGYDMVVRILNDEKLMDELKSIIVKITRYSIRASGGYVKI